MMLKKPWIARITRTELFQKNTDKRGLNTIKIRKTALLSHFLDHFSLSKRNRGKKKNALEIEKYPNQLNKNEKDCGK